MVLKISKLMVLLVLTALLFSSLISPTSSGEEEEILSSSIPTRIDPRFRLDHLIITTSELKESFEPLARWRSQMGLRCEIHTLDGIVVEGDDDAERLLNYLDLMMEKSNNRLEYVLLGGDSNIIPTRYLHANASKFGLDDEYLSDVYYASPGLEWDHDRDGIYGEREDIEAIGVENISFPLKVGRAPVQTPAEAERFVQNIIDYETSPPEGDWLDKGIIASSLMDTPNRFDDPGTPGDEGYNDYKDNAYKAIENYTMAYIPRSLDISHYHDYTTYQGGQYSGENDTLKANTLPAAISNGSAFFTFAGQSFYDVEYPVSPSLAYSLAHWFDDSGTATPPSLGFQPALTHDDTWNLTNGGKLPVVYISSCDSANFSDPDELDLENMLYAQNGGAICFIGSTGISWRGEGEDYSLGNWYLMSRFWQNYMSTNRPGDSLYALKEQYLDQKWDEIASKEPLLVGLYTYNYLGDPALRSWVGRPREFMVQVPEDTMYAGGDSLEFYVRDELGTPIAGARASLYMEGTGQVFTSTSGPDGKVDAYTIFNNGGAAKLTITHRNYIPNIMNITVLDKPADVWIDEDSLSYSPVRPSEGTILNVSATVRNSGGRDLKGVTVAIFFEEITDLTGDLPPSIGSTFVDIPRNGSVNVSFETYPLRSWTGIWFAATPFPDEITINNNIAFLEIPINARPKFIPGPYLELEEDPGGPVFFDLSLDVFDPDDDPLNFTLEEGAPSWITLHQNGTLEIMPPLNWSGIIQIGVKVNDGLASDATEIGLFIMSKNDAPALVDIRSEYSAVADSPFTLRLDIIDAEGDEVEVEIISELDKLTLMGNLLRVVPYSEDIGIHEVELILTDSTGANRTYRFTIEVMGPSNSLYFTEPSVHLPTAYIGKEYIYTVSIAGELAEDAVFSSNSSLILIDNQTGEIRFTPMKSDEGEHWPRITVISGNVTISRSFIIKIEEKKDIVPDTVFWALGIGIVLLIVIIIGLYLWSGPSLEQYGLEE